MVCICTFCGVLQVLHSVSGCQLKKMKDDEKEPDIQSYNGSLDLVCHMIKSHSSSNK